MKENRGISSGKRGTGCVRCNPSQLDLAPPRKQLMCHCLASTECTLRMRNASGRLSGQEPNHLMVCPRRTTAQEQSALRSGAKFMRSSTTVEYDMYVVSVPEAFAGPA